jgi:transposase
MEKLLEGANLKLSSVVSDLTGASGRAMLEALAAGTEDPTLLAELARGSLRQRRGELRTALRGLIGDHQRLLLQSLLRHIGFLEAEITMLDEEVARRMAPFEAMVEQLDTIPGIGRRIAEEVLAEIGTDMSRFPSSAHLASWARVCPGQRESAGKQKPVSTGHANRWLRSALTQAAQAAAHKRDSYYQAFYRRLAARRGKKRAIIALTHSILIVIYHLLQSGDQYQDLGIQYFDRRDQQRLTNRLVHRLQGLGYKVSLEAA